MKRLMLRTLYSLFYALALGGGAFIVTGFTGFTLGIPLLALSVAWAVVIFYCAWSTFDGPPHFKHFL